MCESRGEDEELNAEEKHEALAFGRLVVSEDWEIPGGPSENAKEDLIRNFNGDIGDEEGDPGVCFGRAFTDFIERTLSHKPGHDLSSGISLNGGE